MVLKVTTVEIFINFSKMPDICLQGVGNKANRRIPKNTPNFPKTNICYPLHRVFSQNLACFVYVLPPF